MSTKRNGHLADHAEFDALYRALETASHNMHEFVQRCGTQFEQSSMSDLDDEISATLDYLAGDDDA